MTEQIEIMKFDYAQVDSETAEYLKGAASRITDIVIKSATDIGKELYEAQERLAQYGYGCFENWYTSFGFSKKTVYRVIDRYKLIVSNWDNHDLIEELPLSLSYEISKPSAPKQLVDATLNGDIRTHKEFKELERIIKDKDSQIEELKARPQQIIEKPVESPELIRKISELQGKLEAVNSQMSNYRNEIAKLDGLKAKETEIQNTYRKIEALKKQKSEAIKEIDDLKAVFEFINRAKEFIKNEMLYVGTLVIPPKEDSEIVKQELNNIISVVENWIYAIKNKFKL